MSENNQNSTDPRRRLASVRSMVVKIGSQVLAGADGRLDQAYLQDVAQQVVQLRAGGIAVTLVSSGAIAAGLTELKLGARPKDLALLQAIAAVGQRRLMDAWAAAFGAHGIAVAQVLLTRQDVDDRARFLNVRNTLHAVQQLSAVAVVNENDTISTDELAQISFGDNDLLAALVAAAMGAELLVLLSGVDGLSDESGAIVSQVDDLTEARRHLRAERSAMGKGGMASKLEAAKLVTAAGETLVLAGGRTPNVLQKIVAGETVGTLFASSAPRRTARSRWIGHARPTGSVVIDEGAVRAVVEAHRSLLPAGVVRVEGSFAPGDVIAVLDPNGREVARGLTNYSSTDVARIAGKRSDEVRALLSGEAYEEVIHRDNMAKG